MTYYAIGEPEFLASNWYKSILDGLFLEKRQKRIPLCILNSTDELNAYEIGGEDVVFVIGSESDWIENTTASLAQSFANRVIVLGNHMKSNSAASYSVVTADIAGDVRLLESYLRSLGRNKIALYGINPASTSDSCKKSAFLSLGHSECDLFFNDGSLAECLDGFLAVSGKYDAVICVNDYAAISLIKHVGDSDLFVTSIGSSRLSAFTPVSITHTYSDYRAYAGAGIDLSRILVKNSDISAITVLMSGGFCIGDSTGNAAASNISLPQARRQSRGDVKFYSDTEICEMIAIENMLSSIDSEDILIIAAILKGETYSTIADSQYMSSGGVKYKLKNMYDMCRVAGRAEFVELLSKYIDPNKLI